MIHLPYDGRSFDLEKNMLEPVGSADGSLLKDSAVQLFRIARAGLNLVVDLTPIGNTMIRPEAVYG